MVIDQRERQKDEVPKTPPEIEIPIKRRQLSEAQKTKITWLTIGIGALAFLVWKMSTAPADQVRDWIILISAFVAFFGVAIIWGRIKNERAVEGKVNVLKYTDAGYFLPDELCVVVGDMIKIHRQDKTGVFLPYTPNGMSIDRWPKGWCPPLMQTRVPQAMYNMTSGVQMSLRGRDRGFLLDAIDKIKRDHSMEQVLDQQERLDQMQELLSHMPNFKTFYIIQGLGILVTAGIGFLIFKLATALGVKLIGG